MSQVVPGQGKPTMKDVAYHAGVSHMTVSRFLKDDPTIRPENRDRIAASIKELNYRPNMIARSMRVRQRGRIAIVVPAGTDIYTPHQILSAAMRTAQEFGYEVEVVSVTGTAVSRTARAMELADSRLVEGVISLAPLGQEHIPLEASDDVPVLAVDDYDDQLRGAGVLLDPSPIGEIVAGLAQLGHKRFFYIGGPSGHPVADSRKIGYQASVRALGLTDCGMWQEGWSGESGLNGIASIDFDAGVTAVVCVTDEIAAGAIKGARHRGWDVPGDVSVTGWDNESVAQYLPPGLTSVQVDHQLLGRRAMMRLVRMLRGLPVQNEDLSTLNTVIWRGSTGPAPK